MTKVNPTIRACYFDYTTVEGDPPYSKQLSTRCPLKLLFDGQRAFPKYERVRCRVVGGIIFEDAQTWLKDALDSKLLGLTGALETALTLEAGTLTVTFDNLPNIWQFNDEFNEEEIKGCHVWRNDDTGRFWLDDRTGNLGGKQGIVFVEAELF